MMFEAKLFKLLCAADTVVVEGYEIDFISDEGDVRGACAMRCVMDDMEWFFHDQVVSVDEGICEAECIAAYPESDEPFQTRIELRVQRPIAPEDIK